MVLLEDGNIESASFSGDEMTPLEDCSEVDIEEPMHGDLLVTSGTLNIEHTT